MPGRAGRNGSTELPSVAVGLQRNVIVMAFCCKKGGGQQGTATANNYTAMVLSITVLRRDEVVAVVPPLHLPDHPVPATLHHQESIHF